MVREGDRQKRPVSVAAHLVRRFVGSLSNRPPDSSDEAWALALLNDGEASIWQQMSAPDRRHAIDVARLVTRRLPEVEAESMRSQWFSGRGEFERSAAVAALMHDSGKVVADVGTFTRAGATLLWAVAPKDLQAAWLDKAGLRRRLAQYRDHPRIGGELLTTSGSHRLVRTWAAEHHRRPANWTVPTSIGWLLKDSDDD